MKKLTILLFAVTLLVGFSSVTMAQSTDNATISANANVVQDMVVGNEFEDLEFNNILVNSAKFIDATDGTVTANGVTGGETRGYFSIEIISGTNVDLTLDVPLNLEDGSSNTLSIDFSDNGDAGTDLNGLVTETKPVGNASVTAITGATGSDFTLTTGVWVLDSEFAMPSGGLVYLALGGQVTATSDQEVGSYTGDITLTATVAD
ncbi:hypothetical protein [Gracilimonas halophila]|uniref:DUF4402 domain-containing protein n=1 Tax=Gracilimonas halophila TaxID=1834464 RepID=A0ABW5JNF2_9BACT